MPSSGPGWELLIASNDGSNRSTASLCSRRSSCQGSGFISSLELDFLHLENVLQRLYSQPQTRHAAGDRRNFDRFENFSGTRSQRECSFAVQAHAARAIQCTRDADHDQFLGLSRQCAFPAESAIHVKPFELFEIFRIRFRDDVISSVLGSERVFLKASLAFCFISTPFSLSDPRELETFVRKPIHKLLKKLRGEAREDR